MAFPMKFKQSGHLASLYEERLEKTRNMILGSRGFRNAVAAKRKLAFNQVNREIERMQNRIETGHARKIR